MTLKLFYGNPYLRETTAKIESVERKGEKIRIKLDRTIFYPEGGGQPSDRGIIEGEGFRIKVEKAEGKEEIWHEGKLKGREPKEGEKVKLLLDWEWRYENMKQHTGQHILSAVLKKLYDSDTTGFQIFERYNKIEINFDGKLNWEHVLKAEKLTNEIIWKDLEVKVEYYDELPKEVAKELRKQLSDKIKGRLRIVKVGDIDTIPCGGTHVRSTKEVGLVKVINFYKKSKNIWRVEFVCGNRALEFLDEILEDYWKSLNEMPNKNRPLVERIEEFKEELKALEDEKTKLRKELWEWKGKALLSEAGEINGIKIVSRIESLPMKDAEAFAIYLVDKNPNTIALIVGKSYLIFAKNKGIQEVSMVELLREVLREFGGGGGGGEVLAKGGGFKAKPEEVLKKAKEKLKHSLQS